MLNNYEYEIGCKLMCLLNNEQCEVIDKVKDGYTYHYILKDTEGTTFQVPHRKILERDFRKE